MGTPHTYMEESKTPHTLEVQRQKGKMRFMWAKKEVRHLGASEDKVPHSLIRKADVQ